MARLTWITADTHFGHAEALEMFGRSSRFATTAQMDSAYIEAINSRVGPDDRLIHLGDFTGPMKLRARREYASDIRRRIRCQRIVLVRGNHDPVDDRRFDGLFESVRDLLRLRRKSWAGCVICSHYPLRVWQGQRDGSALLYAHTHGTIAEVGRSTDVGVDQWHDAPVRLEQLVAMLNERPIECQTDFTRYQQVREPLP